MDNKKNSIIERWKTDKSIGVENISQCSLCKNKTYKRTCKAYPDEIPEDLLFNRVIHNKLLGDDNGIIFEPKKEEYKNIQFNPLI